MGWILLRSDVHMCGLGTGALVEISDSALVLGAWGLHLVSLGLLQWHFDFWRQGDVSETVRVFFEQSKSFPPAAKSLLTIQEVDEFLLRLSKLTKEDEQQQALQDIASRWACCPGRAGPGEVDSLGKEGLGVQSSSKAQWNVPHPSRCTANDLKCIIRLIKHDLKMNSGAKHV